MLILTSQIANYMYFKINEAVKDVALLHRFLSWILCYIEVNNSNLWHLEDHPLSLTYMYSEFLCNDWSYMYFLVSMIYIDLILCLHVDWKFKKCALILKVTEDFELQIYDLWVW